MAVMKVFVGQGAPLESPHLTARQVDVARLIAHGYTNAQIAAQLVLQPGTVANHVARILSRLGVANRAQVAVWAMRQGLLDAVERDGHARVA